MNEHPLRSQTTYRTTKKLIIENENTRWREVVELETSRNYMKLLWNHIKLSIPAAKISR